MKAIIKTFFWSVILIAIGVGLSVFGNKVVNEYLKKNDNFIEVSATVIDYYYPGEPEEGAYTAYEYIVDGIAYRIESGLSTNLPDIGTVKTIKYNPSNPTEVVLDENSNYAVVFVGAGFVLAGVFGIFRCIVMLCSGSKKSKNVNVSEEA